MINSYSQLLQASRLVAAAIVLSVFTATSAFAEASCEEIIETGPYPYSTYFTKGPGYAGCFAGQAIGGVIGAPFALIYAPVTALTDSEDEDTCEDAASPITDSAEFVGRMLGYAVGAPFMLLESLFTCDCGREDEDY